MKKVFKFEEKIPATIVQYYEVIAETEEEALAMVRDGQGFVYASTWSNGDGEIELLLGRRGRRDRQREQGADGASRHQWNSKHRDSSLERFSCLEQLFGGGLPAPTVGDFSGCSSHCGGIFRHDAKRAQTCPSVPKRAQVRRGLTAKTLAQRPRVSPRQALQSIFRHDCG